MDARIAQLTSELTGEGLALREAEGKLKALTSSLTSAQAKQALVECEDDIREKTEKLSQLKKSSGNVTADDRRRVQDQHRKSLGEWRKRKRITNDIVDAIMEGYPKKKKDLYEEVGLETDQDVGVTLPS
ncbi:homologous-pairing protein 2 homolog [Pollicipes pollicipes]|uniref:homologous-pairing protein 2 homolog n=1 Tax=Pollicipes pollicipes TaxID=41117 RepID=UPI001884B6D8|nr:homologous-pairing protein 2 homolog [Pollicipes pollicipes]